MSTCHLSCVSSLRLFSRRSAFLFSLFLCLSQPVAPLFAPTVVPQLSTAASCQRELDIKAGGYAPHLPSHPVPASAHSTTLMLERLSLDGTIPAETPEAAAGVWQDGGMMLPADPQESASDELAYLLQQTSLELGPCGALSWSYIS